MSHITYVLMFLFAFHHFLFSSLNQIWRDAYRLFWLLLTLHSYLYFLISTFYYENFQLTLMFSVDSWITALIKTFNKNLHITKCQTVHTRCYQLQLIQFDNREKKSLLKLQMRLYFVNTTLNFCYMKIKLWIISVFLLFFFNIL